MKTYRARGHRHNAGKLFRYGGILVRVTGDAISPVRHGRGNSGPLIRARGELRMAAPLPAHYRAMIRDAAEKRDEDKRRRDRLEAQGVELPDPFAPAAIEKP